MPGVIWTCAALTFYGISGALYLGFLGGLKESAAQWARLALGVGLLFHIVEICVQALAGYHPVSSAQHAVAFSSFLVAAAFFAATFRWRLHVVGAVVPPVAVVMLLAARLTPGAAAGPAAELGLLGRVHITLAILGTAVYSLAAALAVIYLIEERSLKRRKVTPLVRKGVALATLDTLLNRSVQVGFPLLTVSIAAGVFWNERRGDGLRPEYLFAMVAWGVLAGLLVTRLTAGWRGRQAALLTVLGFAASLVVLAIYIARRVMGA